MGEETKQVSLWKMILFTICSILVLDTFVAPAIIGVSSITIWVITAIFFFFPYGLISAELGSAYPDDGGIVSWVKRAYGDKSAVMVGWFYWVNVAFWMPAVFVAFSGWFSYAFAPDAPNWVLAAIAIAMCWLVVWIGVRGVDLSVAVTNVAAVCKVAVLLIFGILGIVYGLKNGFANDFSLKNFIPSFDNTLVYAPTIVYNLLGFELIASIGSNIKNPEKNVPKMTIFAGVCIAALYIFGTFGILAAVPAAQVDTVDGFFFALQELCSVFGPAQKPVFSVIILVAMATLVSNMVAWSMGANETLDATELDKRSKLLAHKNKKHGTNDYAYFIMGALATVLIVLNFSLSGNANDVFWNIFAFSSVVFMLPYLWMFPAAWKLRKTDAETPRPYKVPGGKGGLLISVVLCEMVILISLFFLFYQPFDFLYHGMLILGTLITALIGYRMYKKGLQ